MQNATWMWRSNNAQIYWRRHATNATRSALFRRDEWHTMESDYWLAIIAGRCAEGLRAEKNSFKRPFPDWRNGIVAVTAGEIFCERRAPAVSHDDSHVQQPHRRPTRLPDESIGGRCSISHDACWTVYQPPGCPTRDLLTSKCQRTADLTRTSSTWVGEGLCGEILIRECRYVVGQITDRPETGRFDEARRTGSGSQLVFWPRVLRSSVSNTSFLTATRKLSALTMCSVALWTDGASTVGCLCPLLWLPNSRFSSALRRCVFNWLRL